MSHESSPHTPPVHQVEILVNEKKVTLPGPKATGLQVKEAAIAQGVNIQLDFVLSEEFGERRSKIVGDTDEVTLHPGQHFTAVAPDDNS